MLAKIGQIILQIFARELLAKMWDDLANLYIDWQVGREKRLIDKATKELKDAQTLEERRKAQDAIDRAGF